MNTKNNPYKVYHKRQTLNDFVSDTHWFHFEYNGTRYMASCHNAVFVNFDDEATLPEDVMCAVQNKIYEMMDKYEKQWSLPRGAQEIADAYCAEEFE